MNRLLGFHTAAAIVYPPSILKHCKTARNDTVPGVTSYSALVELLQNFVAILQAQIIDIQYMN